MPSPAAIVAPSAPATGRVLALDSLGRENSFRRLGVGADDDRVGHQLQPPASDDPLNLANRTRSIAPSGDQDGVGSALDLPQHWVIVAIEKILHRTRKSRQILRGQRRCSHPPRADFPPWRQRPRLGRVSTDLSPAAAWAAAWAIPLAAPVRECQTINSRFMQPEPRG